MEAGKLQFILNKLANEGANPVAILYIREDDTVSFALPSDVSLELIRDVLSSAMEELDDMIKTAGGN